MKKIIIFSLMIFWIAALSLLGSSLALTKGNGALSAILPANDFFADSAAGMEARIPAADNSGRGLALGDSAEVLSAQNNNQGNAQPNILNARAVALHNSFASCWMIIGNKVYDLTSYLSKHPAGASSMLTYCGKDGTVAFNTKEANPGKPHSSYAQNLLGPYYVGTLGQSLGGVVALNSSASGKNNVAAPTSTPAKNSNQAGNVSLPLLQTPNSAPNQNLTPAPSSSAATLTSAIVATHNSAASCWMVISNKVYDITSYLPRHPGGINAILPYCGKDGAAAFAGLPHSQNAENLLVSYLVGNLNNAPAPIASSPTLIPLPAGTPTITPAPREDDDDDD